MRFSERLSYAVTDPGAVGFLQGLTEATEATGYELVLLPGMRSHPGLPAHWAPAVRDGRGRHGARDIDSPPHRA